MLYSPKELFTTSIVIGCWILFTSFLGISGACTRRSSYLNIFTYCLIFGLLILVLGGSYSMYKVVDRRNNFQKTSRQTYLSWGSGVVDVQIAYSCCGYIQGDQSSTIYSSAISENSTVIGLGFSNLTNNPCYDPAISVTYEGCYNKGNSYFQTSVSVYAIAWPVMIVFCLILIALARSSKWDDFVKSDA